MENGVHESDEYTHNYTRLDSTRLEHIRNGKYQFACRIAAAAAAVRCSLLAGDDGGGGDTTTVLCRTVLCRAADNRAKRAVIHI